MLSIAFVTNVTVFKLLKKQTKGKNLNVNSNTPHIEHKGAAAVN